MKTINIETHQILLDDDVIVNPTTLRIRKSRNTYYCYITTDASLLHRVVTKARKYFDVVDHINGNGLDNRRENLRFVSNQQNLVNSIKYEKHKGVYKCSYSGKWYARIKDGKTRRNLGSFLSEQDAILAYKTAQCKLIERARGGM